MTSLRKFAHIVEWSDEDRCYIGTVPSMPGCTATGDTVQETMKNLEAAKLEWTDEAERIKAEKEKNVT